LGKKGGEDGEGISTCSESRGKKKKKPKEEGKKS